MSHKFAFQMSQDLNPSSYRGAMSAAVVMTTTPAAKNADDERRRGIIA